MASSEYLIRNYNYLSITVEFGRTKANVTVQIKRNDDRHEHDYSLPERRK